jgi:UDPglucose 6-dehydrogenase
MQGILASNVEHTRWADQRVQDLVRDIPDARVALLGLTYKAGTDTLRRSTALELAQRLIGRGFAVSAYDPAVRELPGDSGGIALRPSAEEALDGADVAVLGTAWPEFASVDAATVLRTMRHPWVVDQTGFLSHLTEDDRLVYMRVGRSPGREAVAS